MKRALVVGALLAGCVTPRVEGLRATEPPLLAWWSTPRVARQPTLRWEPFQAGAGVRVVGYDLRIWHVEREVRDGEVRLVPARLAYARDALAGPAHTVETPLEADTVYVWTVRARLDVGGASRVTPWSRVVAPAPSDDGTVIPDRNYYRFRTAR